MNHPKRILPEQYEPGPHDIICGRGRNCFHHAGNVKFRAIIEGLAERYSQCGEDKMSKVVLVTEVLDRVHRPFKRKRPTLSKNGGIEDRDNHNDGPDNSADGANNNKNNNKNSEDGLLQGMFVRRDMNSGQWYEIHDIVAREKISSAFRDVLHDKYSSSALSKKRRREERTQHPQAEEWQKQQQQKNTHNFPLIPPPRNSNSKVERGGGEVAAAAGGREPAPVANGNNGREGNNPVVVVDPASKSVRIPSSSSSSSASSSASSSSQILPQKQAPSTAAAASTVTAKLHCAIVDESNSGKTASSASAAPGATSSPATSVESKSKLDEDADEGEVSQNPWLPRDRELRELRENDVLCGRGPHITNHPGNVEFQNSVKSLLADYYNAPTTEKTEIVNFVLDQVWAREGRFWKEDVRTGKWYQIDRTTARTKVSQAFRDGLGASKSKLRREEDEKRLTWEIRAHQGDSEAQYQMALSYKLGNGSNNNNNNNNNNKTSSGPNMARAAEWFEKAAQRGHAQAQYELAMCYHDGEGVQQNLPVAVQWYCQAAARFYFARRSDRVMDLSLEFDLAGYMHEFQSDEVYATFQHAFNTGVVNYSATQQRSMVQLQHPHTAGAARYPTTAAEWAAAAAAGNLASYCKNGSGP
ncbi:hypothetical protein ACA910_001668 [Epithemia clementina (nom. ined.)]